MNSIAQLRLVCLGCVLACGAIIVLATTTLANENPRSSRSSAPQSTSTASETKQDSPRPSIANPTSDSTKTNSLRGDPVGPCCYFEFDCSCNDCIITTAQDCDNLFKGSWLGEFATCDACYSGACCFNDGSCSMETEAECNGVLGGSYQGDTVYCKDITCDIITGACCYFDGSCTEEFQIDCDDGGGTYHGDFTTCAFRGNIICPEPPDCDSAPRTFTLDNPDGDFFAHGWSVAISGDRVITGAPGYTFGFAGASGDAGVAYVWDVKTGDLIYTLHPHDPAPGKFFGNAVAIHGNIAVVGAEGDDHAGGYSGAAYIFDLTTGDQLHKLTPDFPTDFQRFGSSVATNGTITLIGAAGDDGINARGGNGIGAAYVFDVATGSQLLRIESPTQDHSTYFGERVAISGNLGVIGAARDAENGPLAGAAFVMDLTTGDELFKLLPSESDSYLEFGYSVDVHGNIAIIGAPGYNDPINLNLEGGTAFLFDITTGNEIANLRPSSSWPSFEYLGASVAIGSKYAVVGAFVPNRALLFDITTGEQVCELYSDPYAAGDFGYAAALDGNAVAIGTPQFAGGGGRGGSGGMVFLYAIAPDAEIFAEFEYQSVGEPNIVVAADLGQVGGGPAAGDGFFDAAVAIPTDPPGGTGAMQVFLNNGVSGVTWLGLTALAPVNVGIDPSGIAAGDLDGDGSADIAVCHATSNDVYVLLNDGTGSGTFLSPIIISAVGNQPSDIAILDANGDGRLDILVTNFLDDTLVIYLNEPPPRSDRGPGVLFNLGQTVNVDANPTSIHPEDLDGDKDIDVAIASAGTSRVTTLKNNPGLRGRGTPGFSIENIINLPPGSVPVDLSSGDFDGNGHTDIISANNGNATISVILGNGDFTFETPVSLSVGEFPSAIAGGDFDNDGLDDIAIVATNQLGNRVIQILFNQVAVPGAVNLDLPVDEQIDAQPNYLVATQLDNLLGIDIITVNEDPGELTNGSVTGLLIAPSVSCTPADCFPIGGDGEVTRADLLAVLKAFGSVVDLACDISPPGGDGVISISDIMAVITQYGYICN